jgi:heme-degrading monooxygenase HmoA
MENQPVVELAIGKVKPGVSREQYLQAAIAVEPDLRRMQGFRKRVLCAGEDRLWVDRVHWNSLADLNKAHEAFQHLESGNEMQRLLDVETITMIQLELLYVDHLVQDPQGSLPEDRSPVVELVISRLNHGITREAYLQAAMAVEADLRRMPGFLSRQLLLEHQGLWFDIVHWRSMEAALAAADALMKLESAQPINAMLDPVTLKMYHLELVYQDTREAAIPAG